MKDYIINTGRRFIIKADGQESYVSYRITGKVMDLYSAYVPAEQRGRGYASDLILYSIHYAVSNGLLVRGSCPAAAEYLRRNTEWNFTLAGMEISTNF